MSSRYAPNEPRCPIPSELLALLLRSNEARVADVVLQLDPLHRASLAAFAYGRSHMRSLGLTVAAHCDAKSLVAVSGAAGEALYESSRQRDGGNAETMPGQRKPVSLARVAA